ncbi:hypothetical protein, partial [Nocardia brasiliensis]|uniref:hypothetical protein n=1 Tax=Nocardia brasiliensis TaxID=37326 RepID=UPI002454EDAA
MSDPVTDPDRVAWHRALAGAGPDEAVALALTRSAAGAPGPRGGGGAGGRAGGGAAPGPPHPPGGRGPTNG